MTFSSVKSCSKRKMSRKKATDGRRPRGQLPRGVKSTLYNTVEYEIDLDYKGSYMCKFRDGWKGLGGKRARK